MPFRRQRWRIGGGRPVIVSRMPELPPDGHVVVVGASLAGLRAAETLRIDGHDGPITVVGAESHRPYDRPPLSKQVLTGKAEPEQVVLPFDHRALGVELMLGRAAVGLDVDRRRLLLAGGDELAYEGLVIATGAAPRLLPGAPPGPGVHYLRTLDDSLALRDELRAGAAVVIIGAGFIGLEVACSATSMGLSVVVVEALPVPLERALGPEVGWAVMGWHRAKGMDLRTGLAVDAIVGKDRPEAVRLSDGTVLDASVVVVGIGVAPATDWLAGSGIDVADGVLCDERLRVRRSGSPLPNVVAAGDVARWAHPAYREDVRVEHWTNATEAGEAAAKSLLLGDDAEPFSPTPYFWSDQHGVKLQFVGRTAAGDRAELLEGSWEEDRMVLGYGRGGRLVGALGMRRPARVMALQRMIAEGSPFPPPE